MDGFMPASTPSPRKKQKENLIQFKAQALLSRELVTIDRHVPVEFDPEQLKTQKPDDDALTRLFAELEFRQLQQEYAPGRPRWRHYTAILDAMGPG
jgi:DNA polymerase-1